ncbi:hypothetical protein EJB37_19465 [Klebsiella pneumoniae]|nr:hypothetical protein [Klebsiella pneumoniae]NGX72777.1 hypothetical protein [Klebsiella pneumoniae]
MTNITELAQRARINAECGEYLSPAETMELVEALESEKRICSTWRKTAESTSEKLEKAQQRIDELENDEVRQLLANAEHQLYMAELAKNNLIASRKAQFRKRKAAEQRIAELESRTVTVKLPDINEYLAEVHDKTLNRAFRLLAEGVRAGDAAAMRAAGIKVEAE